MTIFLLACLIVRVSARGVSLTFCRRSIILRILVVLRLRAGSICLCEDIRIILSFRVAHVFVNLVLAILDFIMTNCLGRVLRAQSRRYARTCLLLGIVSGSLCGCVLAVNRTMLVTSCPLVIVIRVGLIKWLRFLMTLILVLCKCWVTLLSRVRVRLSMCRPSRLKLISMAFGFGIRLVICMLSLLDMPVWFICLDAVTKAPSGM